MHTKSGGARMLYEDALCVWADVAECEAEGSVGTMIGAGGAVVELAHAGVKVGARMTYKS